MTLIRSLLICFGIAAAVMWLASWGPREQSNGGEGARPELVLGDPQECPALSSSSIPIRLCKSSGWDPDTFVTFRNRLSGNKESRAAVLCQYEADLAQSLRDCSISNQSDASAVSSLMSLLAYGWLDAGKLDKADEWFERAYDLLDPTYAHYGDTTLFAILEGWARLKVKNGELARAKDLAHRLTTLKRVHTDEVGMGWSSLVRTLKFEAKILEQAGFHEEAGAARGEAEQLEALPDPCSRKTCVGTLRIFPKSALRSGSE